MEFSLATPRGFSFKRTVLSHGWCGLLPFEFDRNNWTLRRVLDLGEGLQPITITINGGQRALQVSVPRQRISASRSAQILRDVRHMFRLDDRLTNFYRLMSADPEFAWVTRAGAGRLLRSPTVFEDLVKLICTTNCSWALTQKMVTNLVNSLGRATPDGRRAFPTPQAMASVPEKFYRAEVRAGYRAPYLKELAERVAESSLDVEGWLTSELPTAELKREMKRVKGVGDYAAENLLKLIGRYEGLALDSWVRAKFARLHGEQHATADPDIDLYYSRFEAWRGLVLWCDVTRDWLDD